MVINFRVLISTLISGLVMLMYVHAETNISFPAMQAGRRYVYVGPAGHDRDQRPARAAVHNYESEIEWSNLVARRL